MTAWLLYLAAAAVIITGFAVAAGLLVDHPGRHERKPLDPADQDTITWLTTGLREIPEPPPAPAQAALLPWVQAILGAPTVDDYLEQNWMVRS